MSYQIHPDYPERLNYIAGQLKDRYISADPFPHIVLDNFFDEDYIESLVSGFPDLSKTPVKEHFENSREVKWASHLELGIPNEHRRFIHFLNSQPFLSFLQEISGISEVLIPDPYLTGGGLHQIKAGGLLKLHADFNKNIHTGLDRRLNAIVYLNKDWREDYGGHLELWDKDVIRCAQKVAPIAHRLVIFSTTDFSYHGHPEELTCPLDRSRNSIALYYYSNGRPKSELNLQVVSSNTIYKLRPDSASDNSAFRSFNKENVIDTIKMLTPPIVLKALHKIKKSL
jgi:hypothetical protein